MSAAEAIDSVPPDDDIRQARRLWAGRSGISTPVERVALARELRRLGRPDQALQIIEQIVPATALVRSEAAACRAALGQTEQAWREITEQRQAGDADIAALELELKLADRLGRSLTTDYCRDAAAAINTTKLAQRFLRTLPLAALPLLGSWPLLAALWRRSPVVAAQLALRLAADRSFAIFATVAAALAFGLIRLQGRRKVVRFTSMGKFTRLADLVDRLDPLLRRLRAEAGEDGFTLVVFFFGGYPNSQLMEMYGRQCRFIHATGRVSGRLAHLFISMLRRAGRHTEITVDYRQIKDDFLAYPPAIAFRPEEARRGDEGLAAAGIDPAKPIVVFGLRDMAYYRFYGNVMNIPLTKQGRRAETHHRCPPLATYVEAAKYWAARGHQVVRMGLRVSESLPPGLDPLIVDYANGPRSDELDAWLFAKCRFLVAGDTGLFSGACAFDRPSVLSDLFLVRNTMYSASKQTPNLFVPKLIRDERSGQLLTFREQIYFSDHFSYAEDCEANGFRIVHNDADDLIDATIELNARLDGTHVSRPDDEQLQQAYWRIYPPGFVGYNSTARIAASFLRKHASLLD